LASGNGAGAQEKGKQRGEGKGRDDRDRPGNSEYADPIDGKGLPRAAFYDHDLGVVNSANAAVVEKGPAVFLRGEPAGALGFSHTW
jgi:hypothetical protein